MVNIRSVTLFAEPTIEPGLVAGFFKDSLTAFPGPVQTARLATTPFPTWWRLGHFTTIQMRERIQPWSEAGAQIISLGPVCLRHDAGWLDRIPDLIACCDTVFVAAEIADIQGQVDIGRCQAVAEIIRRLSMLKADGSASLQFGALANCRPGTPFFPSAYHRGGSPVFAVGIEGASLVNKIIEEARSLAEARTEIIAAIEAEAQLINEAAVELAAAHLLEFSGIDFSLAPFPKDDSSLVGAMEKLGLAQFGRPGTTFVAAFLADTIDQAEFKRCGFSGLFFPVLEDSVLATRAGDSTLTVNDLLSYSAVCGTGLDTVPLAGNTSLEALAGILLDVGALASRLDKPLTARLMPIPGLVAGDPVNIDFPWFSPAFVMGLAPHGIQGHLRVPTRVQLKPFRNRH